MDEGPLLELVDVAGIVVLVVEPVTVDVADVTPVVGVSEEDAKVA